VTGASVASAIRSVVASAIDACVNSRRSSSRCIVLEKETDLNTSGNTLESGESLPLLSFRYRDYRIVVSIIGQSLLSVAESGIRSGILMRKSRFLRAIL